MVRSGKILGIDFGTTFSLLAIMDENEPVIIPNLEGSSTTPSVVAFQENGKVLVGELARRQAASNPQRTIFAIKRILGLDYYELEEREKELYHIIDKDGLPYINLGERLVSPEEVAIEIFRYLHSSARHYLEQEELSAVITVPAYFNELQREVIKRAAQRAGLEVLRLINEPTAAALAFGLGKSEGQLVGVYDFGGGTFDISLLEIEENAFEVMASFGNPYLGGNDIDRALAEMLTDEFEERHQVDLHLDPAAWFRLKEACEQAKCELSSVEETVINLPFVSSRNDEPLHLERTIKRSELEEIVAPVAEETLYCCRQVVEDAGLSPQEIGRVILVGGSTRIPLVQNEVQEFFGKKPHRVMNPQEIVALGAAVQAGVMEGKLREVVLMDITPYTLGIETEDNGFSKLIEKNVHIPIRTSKLFTTTMENQSYVNIHILQGDSEHASNNKSLGRFILSGIPPSLAGVPRIRVSFFMNVDGILDVSATELSSGSEKSLTLTHLDLSADERKSRRKRQVQLVHSRAPDASVKAIPDKQATAVRRQPALVVQLEEMLGSSRAELEEALSAELLAALEALERGEEPPEPEQTEAELEELRINHPEQLLPYYYLLRLAMLGDHPEKVRQLIEAYLSSPGFVPEVGCALVESVLVHFPTYPDFRTVRAKLLIELGREGEALKELEEIVKLADEPLALNLLLQHYRQLYKHTSSPTTGFKLVKLLLKMKELDQAIELLQELQRFSDYRPRALKIMGLCLWQKNLLYLAWQKFKQLPLNQELLDILYRLALDMEEQEQLDYAADVLSYLTKEVPAYKDVAARLDKVTHRKQALGAATGHETGELLGARFEILDEINRGSMGIIYKGSDKVLGELVAIKVLADYLFHDREAVKRFKAEAVAAKRLSHPHIVRIHDLYETKEHIFISMEFIKGTDFKRLLSIKQSLDEEKVERYLLQICDALEYAHSLGVIHRDIKPANVMADERDNVKITDFGIAKILSAEESRQAVTSIIGTPLYMAPEQVVGGLVDARTDIYSLGITLFEMLTGSPPFTSGSVEYHHLHTPPPALPEGISSVLRELVSKCLRKDPRERFQTVREILEFFQSAGADS